MPSSIGNTSCAAVLRYIYIYISDLKDGSRWLQPHAHSAGVLAEDAFSHLTQRLGPTKEVIAQRARQPDYNALTLSLGHRSLKMRLFR